MIYQATDYVLARAEEPPHMLPSSTTAHGKSNKAINPTSAVSKVYVKLKVTAKSRPSISNHTAVLFEITKICFRRTADSYEVVRGGESYTDPLSGISLRTTGLFLNTGGL